MRPPTAKTRTNTDYRCSTVETIRVEPGVVPLVSLAEQTAPVASSGVIGPPDGARERERERGVMAAVTLKASRSNRRGKTIEPRRRSRAPLSGVRGQSRIRAHDLFIYYPWNAGVSRRRRLTTRSRDRARCSRRLAAQANHRQTGALFYGRVCDAGRLALRRRVAFLRSSRTRCLRRERRNGRFPRAPGSKTRAEMSGSVSL